MKKKAKKKAQKKVVHKKLTLPKRTQHDLVPLGDRVIVRPLSQEEIETKTASGILLPDSAITKDVGWVVAVGNGRTENGIQIPIEVKVGDKVLFDESAYSRKEVKIGGVKHLILREADIIAIKN